MAQTSETRIVLHEWLSGDVRWAWRTPRLLVMGAGSDPLAIVDIVLPKERASGLLRAAGLNPDIEPERKRLDNGLLRFGVQRLAQAVQQGTIPLTASRDIRLIALQDADLPVLLKLLRDKTCDYQLHEGRDLLCSATSPQDPSAIGTRGLRSMAPTSRALCRSCNLPDTDSICSHLLHPEIFLVSATQGALKRGLAATRPPMCDLGRPEINNQPGLCRVGGHQCAEYLVEPALDSGAATQSPLTLPEAFDFLDAVWRLAFNKTPLLRVRRASDAAGLTQPCATASDFKARMSDLADMLKSFEIADELLVGSAEKPRKDETMKRLVAALEGTGRLDDADIARLRAAVDDLVAVGRLRVALQHSGASSELPGALAKLQLPFPIVNWDSTWDGVRARTAAALGVIRDVVWRLAQ